MAIDFGQGHERTARTDYRCHLCDEKIPAGSRYTRFTGKWEGDFQNWTAHTACFQDHDGGECPYPGPNAWQAPPSSTATSEERSEA